MPASAVRGPRPTATRTFSASFTCGLPAASVKAYLYAAAGLLDFFDLAADVHIDAALLVGAGELLRDLFIFNRNNAREGLDDGDIGAEALEDRGELDTNRSRADDDERLWQRRQGEDLDVGEDGVVGLVAGQHARVGAGGEDNLLRQNLGCGLQL